MNPLSRRRATKAPELGAMNAQRREAVNLSIAKRKAKRQTEAILADALEIAEVEKQAAVDAAITEVVSALGFDIADSVDPA